jgi:RimJ/RimL family protein N-acetyltransferase
MHVLVTRRLTLRPPVLADAEEIALQLSNWNVARMLARIPYPYHPEDAEDWIRNLAKKPEDLVYTVHRERLIGIVSIESGDGEPRLGYWLGEPWRGRGFMTEAAGKLLQYAFATRGYRAVQSSAFIDNPASLRVQEKLGFVVTGTGEAWSRPRAARVETWTTRLTASAFGEFSQTMRKSAA